MFPRDKHSCLFYPFFNGKKCSINIDYSWVKRKEEWLQVKQPQDYVRYPHVVAKRIASGRVFVIALTTWKVQQQIDYFYSLNAHEAKSTKAGVTFLGN